MSLRGPLLLLVPIGLYLAHACLYGSWLVDDAAISFAYARELAAGHGCVAQPGAAPVEGYSNPLWTLLLALCCRLGAFDPVLTPKLTAAALVAVAIQIFGHAAAGRAPRRQLAAVLALSLLALNPCLVIWTMSGLENGLQLALVAVQFLLLVRTLRGEHDQTTAALAGVTAAALAMTRPDAAIWLIAWPIARLWHHRRTGAGTPWPRRPCAVYAATAGALLAAFLGHRLTTFGELLPNTFQAKQAGDGLRLPLAVLGTPLAFVVVRVAGAAAQRRSGRRWPRWAALAIAVLGIALFVATGARDLLRGAFGWSHLVLGAGWLLLLAYVRPLRAVTSAAVLGTMLGATQYLALPRDWMGHLRFGTAFFPCVLLALFGLLADAGLLRRRRHVVGATAILAILLLPDHCRRMQRFRANPTLPVQELWREHEATWERYRHALGPAADSILTEDIGAPLYFGTLRVHDLGGLADRRIGRLICRAPGPLADLVFGELRPSLVRFRRYIAKHSGLHDDPRFRLDYAVIHEELQPRENDDTGPLVPVGDYVRRDLLRDDAQLAELRRIHGP